MTVPVDCRPLRRWLLAVIGLAMLAGCGQPGTQPGPLLFAAASMQNALDEAADDWAAQGHARPVVSYAASSALARQIESGAPADLFLSADTDWMDSLAARGLLRPGTRIAVASNRLALIAPTGSAIALKPAPGFPLAEALRDGRLAVAETEAVPAGRYARAALESLGVWDSVSGRLAPAENVRAALMLVARGAAPVGITYATDAWEEPRVKVLGLFPRASHPPIVYPLAMLKQSRSPDAEAFRNFLISPAGQAIFARHGFGPA